MREEWYEKYIEEPIRPLVKLLRNNGFNTTCSCGHQMYVEMENYHAEEVEDLYNLLMENGYHNFRITLIREPMYKSLKVEILPESEQVIGRSEES